MKSHAGPLLIPSCKAQSSLMKSLSVQVLVAIDGQCEVELEAGKHFWFSVADHVNSTRISSLA